MSDDLDDKALIADLTARLASREQTILELRARLPPDLAPGSVEAVKAAFRLLVGHEAEHRDGEWMPSDAGAYAEMYINNYRLGVVLGGLLNFLDERLPHGDVAEARYDPSRRTGSTRRMACSTTPCPSSVTRALRQASPGLRSRT
jgi:hypothetical protein